MHKIKSKVRKKSVEHSDETFKKKKEKNTHANNFGFLEARLRTEDNSRCKIPGLIYAKLLSTG